MNGVSTCLGDSTPPCTITVASLHKNNGIKHRSIPISTLCLLLFNLETFKMNLLYLSNNSRIGCHAGGFLPKHYILLGKRSLVTPLPGARFKVWQLSSVCVCKIPAFLAVATFALCTQETSDLFGSWQNSFLSIQVLLPS